MNVHRELYLQVGVSCPSTSMPKSCRRTGLGSHSEGDLISGAMLAAWYWDETRGRQAGLRGGGKDAYWTCLTFGVYSLARGEDGVI